MKKWLFAACCLYTGTAWAQYAYPATKKADSVNTYFGVAYKDPYQWLENLKDTGVVSWFKQQANFTDSILQKIDGRDRLLAEWKKLDSLQPAHISDRVYANGRIFYKKRMPGEKLAKLYVREGDNGAGRLLFDPGSFISGKTLSIQKYVPSFDGKYLAIAYSAKGAEVSTIRIVTVATGQFLADELFPVFDLSSWTFDNKAILYVWLPSADNTDPNARRGAKTRLHTVGTDSKGDIDFFSSSSNPELKIDSSMYPISSLTRDNKNYIFSVTMTVQRELNLYYAPIGQLYSRTIQWKSLCQPENKIVRGLEFMGDMVFAITYEGAKNFKLIETDIKKPDWPHAKIIAAEKSDQTLESITHCRNYLLMTYNDGINSHLFKYNPSTGQTAEIRLPLSGTIEVECLNNQTDTCTVRITSWVKPVAEFDFDPGKEIFTPSTYNQPPVYPEAYDQLQVKEVTVKARDGALIPLSIIYRKDTKLDGNNVCLLEGYGAYGISIPPGFEVQDNSLTVRGVVTAVAHVRGGSEKGQSWYEDGYKATKHHTWEDFNDCAEYLIAQGWTRSSKLAASGSSAGGILISRAITERPDLYRAVICNVGLANIMRAEFSSNGPANIPEFGTVKDSIGCRTLYAMDGLQHVVNGVRYPAVICIGGWNDPRVVPWQPGKFAAAMQNASGSGNPVLLKINYNSGHTTADRSVSYANIADYLAFVLWQCGHPDFQLKTD
jgi:prolyl oligopeptidase